MGIEIVANELSKQPAIGVAALQNARATACGITSDADHRIELLPIGQIAPYQGNARTHSKKQVGQIAESIKRFGFNNPVLIDENGVIVAGHGRVAAAKLLGLKEVPALRLSHLSPAEKKAYILADNKLAENAGWNKENLAIELQELVDLNFEAELTGFETGEIAIILDNAGTAQRETAGRQNKALESRPSPHVSTAGDVWAMGNHRLLCGDASDNDAVDAAVRVWQSHTGKAATLAATGQTFTQTEKERLAIGLPTGALGQLSTAAGEAR
jgi:hypothetical protein